MKIKSCKYNAERDRSITFSVNTTQDAGAVIYPKLFESVGTLLEVLLTKSLITNLKD